MGRFQRKPVSLKQTRGASVLSHPDLLVNDEMSMKTFFAETKLFLSGENVEQTSCDLLVVPQPTKVSWYCTKRNSHAEGEVSI